LYTSRFALGPRFSEAEIGGEKIRNVKRPSGLRYLPVGGTSKRSLISIYQKLESTAKIGKNPTGQMHALLGGVLEVNTSSIFLIFFGYRPCKAFDNSLLLFFRQDARE